MIGFFGLCVGFVFYADSCKRFFGEHSDEWAFGVQEDFRRGGWVGAEARSGFGDIRAFRMH